MTEDRLHIEEGIIHAWLDGALAPDEALRVERHVAECDACSAGVAEARGLMAASSRILAALDAVPAGVIPDRTGETDRLAAIRRWARPARVSWWKRRQFLAAASVLFMAGAATAAWKLRDTNNMEIAPLASVPVPEVARSATEAVATDSRAAQPGAVAEAKATRSDASGSRPVAVQSEPVPPPTGAVAKAEADRLGERARTERVATAPPAAVAANEARVEARFRRDAAIMDSAVPTVRQLTTQAQAELPKQGVDQLGRQVTGAQRDAALQQGFASAAQRRGDRAAMDSLQKTLSAVVVTGVTGATPSPQVPAGCYELRGPAPVSARLLGVPVIVRLLDEATPQGGDSSWMKATELEQSELNTSLIWRQVDPATVELRVRRPVDSTVVRFRSRYTGTPLSRATLPPGIELAEATRVICR